MFQISRAGQQCQVLFLYGAQLGTQVCLGMIGLQILLYILSIWVRTKGSRSPDSDTREDDQDQGNGGGDAQYDRQWQDRKGTRGEKGQSTEEEAHNQQQHTATLGPSGRLKRKMEQNVKQAYETIAKTKQYLTDEVDIERAYKIIDH